ncbi:MAG: DUF354 domain-containing protein [Myxococcota bacterium]
MARVWIDLANSPHVLFFAPIVGALRDAGHEVTITGRDFAQTLPLCETFGLDVTAVGRHGGTNRALKVANLAGRAAQLGRFGAGRGFDVAVSHNSYAHVVAARGLRIPTATLMDYEFQPANHLAFRLANLVMVPSAFFKSALRRCGASPGRTFRYEGLKEEVVLDGFTPDPAFRRGLGEVFERGGVDFDADAHVLVTVRPAATMAAYHRFENPLFDRLLRRLGAPRVRGLLLPRTNEQRMQLGSRLPPGFVMPERSVDGRELVAASDVVISAGGSMIREAAVVGTPAFSIYAGRIGGVDEQLIRSGRMHRIATDADIEGMMLERRATPAVEVRSPLRGIIVERILGLAAC